MVQIPMWNLVGLIAAILFLIVGISLFLYYSRQEDLKLLKEIEKDLQNNLENELIIGKYFDILKLNFYVTAEAISLFKAYQRNELAEKLQQEIIEQTEKDMEYFKYQESFSNYN